MKVCYIIKCDFERELWIDNKMPSTTITTGYVTGQEQTIARETYHCLSQFATQAKKFYALDIAEKYKERLKGKKFSYGKAVGFEAKEIKVTTPKDEGFIEIDELKLNKLK